MRRRANGALIVAAALASMVVACTSEDDASAPTTATVPERTTTASTSTSTSPATTSTAPIASTSAATTTTASTTTSPAPPTTEPATTFPQLPRLMPFADYRVVPALADTSVYAGPSTPSSLDAVDMTDSLRQWIARDDEIVARIEENGFVVVPLSQRWFHTVYQGFGMDQGTLFVTTDAAYNLWHAAFDKVLRDTEEKVLLPALERLVIGLLDGARRQLDELPDPGLADAAARVVALYEAAATLLTLDVGAIDPRAQQTVELALDAVEVTTSPLTGYEPCRLPESFEGCVDYSLFRPRGHYTRSAALERYFRTMTLLGQEAFYIDGAESLRLGVLAARPVVTDTAVGQLWRDVYEPSAFLVGVADDYTPMEVAQAATSIDPNWIDDPAGVLSDEGIEQVAEALTSSREVAIDPENASVRIMGARFVLDSFVLDQLAYPNVGTPDDRRVFVSPLDLASAWGSPLATRLQEEAGEPQYQNYESQLDAMRRVLTGRRPDDWAGTVYDSWLFALEPQFVPKGAAYPDFMRTDAWAAKALQTGFGSYTELKHDTVLYAKQGTAGEGEGPPPPPFVPHHWVEPDPVAFGRIAAAAELTRDGLSARGMLPDESAALLDSVVEIESWLERIAGEELAGVVTSAEDNARLGDIGHELELLWFESADVDITGGMLPTADDDAALVADIFRSSFFFLELGVGRVDEIDVIVPDGSGGFQLARGAVYSYYEFWRPDEMLRLTDPEWRQLLDTGEAPPRPQWVSEFLVGGDIATTPHVEQVP